MSKNHPNGWGVWGRNGRAFSPKDLGLSVGIYGTVFGQFGLDLWIVLGSSETDYWTVDGPMCAIFDVIAKDE